MISEVFYPESFLVNDLVAEWQKMGCNIQVLTRTPSYPAGYTLKGYKNKLYQKNVFNQVEVHRVPIVPGYAKSKIRKILNYLCFVIGTSIFILFRGKRYNRLFIYQTGPLTVGIAGVIWKLIHKGKLIIYTQDVWPETVYAYGFKKTRVLAFVLDRFVKWIYRHTDTVLVSCPGFVNKIRQFKKDDGNIVYMPNWSLITENSTEKIILNEKMNFTFAGNIGKVQNLENVIKGFDLFNRDKQVATLNIIGDGSNMDTIKDIIHSEKVGDVRLWGRQPIESMYAYLSASDVLIISLVDKPVFDLTIPSKFQAYISIGKPLLGIINGETARLINENNIGHCASPGSLDEIAAAFEKLYKMRKEDLQALGERAKVLSKTEFDRTTLINKLTHYLLQ